MTAPDPRLGEIEDSIHGLISTVAWPETPEERDEAEIKVTAHINHLLAELRKAQDALGRVEGLAAMWTSRGEHDMAYSKTVPDEDIAMELLTHGAGMVENARHLRAAVAAATGGEQ